MRGREEIANEKVTRGNGFFSTLTFERHTFNLLKWETISNFIYTNYKRNFLLYQFNTRDIFIFFFNKKKKRKRKKSCVPETK